MKKNKCLKKILLTLGLAVIFGVGIQAQPRRSPTIDTVKVRCLYRQLFVMDTLDLQKKTEDLMLLDAGKNITKYHSYYKDLADSVVYALIDKNVSQSEVANTIVKMTKGSMVADYTVYKNYPEGKLTLADYFGFDYNIYEEQQPDIQWALSGDTATVCGYLCKKATSAFRGRNYEAWYAPEIPLREGPWKLGGLPGLILKAKDGQSYFTFECIAIETPKGDKVIEITSSIQNKRRLKKTDYNKAKQRYMDNSSAYTSGNPLKPSDLPAHNYKKKPYNPIERTED
jgi:GLPGLI family protein